MANTIKTVFLGKHKEFECQFFSKNGKTQKTLVKFHPYKSSTKLIKVSLPKEINSIEKFAFVELQQLFSSSLCSQDQHIEIDVSDVSVLPDHLFRELKNVTKITLSSSLKVIPAGLFSNCHELSEIKIPNSVEEICDSAFSSLHLLKSLRIPANVKKIGESIVDDCINLEKIIVDPKNKIYNSRNNCNAIIETKCNKLIAGCLSTEIPQTVKAIEKRAFANCKYLTSINFPKHLKSIGQAAFCACYCLSHINDIPKGCKVGKHAFALCPNLSAPEKVFDIKR